MISFFKREAKRPPVIFFNTLGRTKEEFKPLAGRVAKMYTCGPTVYDFAHIGNLRSYVFSDTVRRTLEYAGYEVRQVINVTDFGHLSSNADDGEDKMAIGLKREGLSRTMANMRVLAGKYEKAFRGDLHLLNIKTPHTMPRASEHVPGMIAYIQALIDKEFAYKTPSAVYFDTALFSRYGRLGGSASSEHSRVGVSTDKRNPEDFALWKFNEHMGWEAPWGKGIPGWHIECTAMSTRYLGKSFDIHTGGVDHIPIHHNNEIAQAEAANGKPYARYWLHNEFVTIDARRIGKSEGNAITMRQLIDRGISPLAYRYWLLTAHYRQKVNFTWESVFAAQTALQRAWRVFSDLRGDGTVHPAYRERFEHAIFDDFNTAEALAVVWDLLKDDAVSSGDTRATILAFDRVLGVGFGSAVSRTEILRVPVLKEEELPEEVRVLLDEREGARRERNFAKADEIRANIEQKGFRLEDGPQGSVVKRI